MSLSEGTKLGPYEITGHIGAGGMGEVYRARDPELGRDVAVKVLPDSLASDAARIERFEREARMLAALNHPNIAHIYGIERIGDTTALVMELVEGETLEQRIAEGPLPADEALGIAMQIADGLEAAHEQLIVHRDLKPANVKLRPDGTVKVLDFGIAKALSPDIPTSESESPIMTTPATLVGEILGTAAYMSPEQAKGKPVDRRADIWSFGCLLYEMLTGQLAFGAEDVATTLARVITSEMALDSLPVGISPAVRRTLELCLRKDPRKRLRDIGDVKLALAGDFDSELSPTVAGTAPTSPITRLGLPIGLLVGAVVAGLGVWFATSTAPLPEPEPLPVSRFEHLLSGEQSLMEAGTSVFSLSPDGRRFVYRTDQGFLLRELDTLEMRLIPGTDATGTYPFFSPDSRNVAFIEQANGYAVRRIGIGGGASVPVSRAWEGLPHGASWSEDGTVFYATPEGIFRVPATGGEPDRLIAAADSELLSSPRLLPDGDSLLFGVYGLGVRDGDIVVQSLTTGERKNLIEGGADARYVPTGHIVYAWEYGLYGIAFDLETLSVSGGPVPLVEGIVRAAINADANYGIAANGTLAYVAGTAGGTPRTVVWVDREGREEPIDLPPRAYFYVQLAPDGTRLALDARDGESDIWVWHLEREVLQRLTFDPGFNRGPLWSPNGERLIFTRNLGTSEEIYWQAADGSGVPEILTTDSDREVFATDMVGDGTAVVFSETNRPRDIWLATIGASGEEPVPLIATPADEFGAQVSPDGHWLAYHSDESGRREIYVTPFPNVGDGRWQVSTGGGTRPRWSRDGGELFYFVQQTGSAPGALMAVTITAGDTFQSGASRKLFEGDYFMASNTGRQAYDVSLDGERFLMIKNVTSGDAGQAARVVIVENWTEELKRLVPTD